MPPSLFSSTATSSPTMFDVFAEQRREMAKIVRPTKDDKLFVAPARLALARLEQQLAGQFDAPFKLKDALAPILKDYDYIVMDTPPALGILTVNALVASTHLLVPIQAAYFAIEGTDDLLETYERIRSRPNPDLKVLGVRHHALRQAHQHLARHARADSRRRSAKRCSRRASARTCAWKKAPPTRKRSSPLRRNLPARRNTKSLPWRLFQRVEEDRVARHSQDAA